MKVNSYLAALLLAVAVFSCKENNTKKTEGTASSNNVALAHLQALDDSCNKAWNMMMGSDDQKIKDIQRLLQEISYIPAHNVQKLERLSQRAKELSTKRYTPETMTSSAIDTYDGTTDSLLKEVFDLKRTTKGVENYTLTEELEASIREADGMVVNYRVLYDSWADKYNQSLDKLPAADASGLKKKMKFAL
ncbi:MAG TPA: hypothetical protein VK750_02745 [Cytophagaceae bacterium]|nr:hypothetical protein [Cytophagaceae bacterium]